MNQVSAGQLKNIDLSTFTVYRHIQQTFTLYTEDLLLILPPIRIELAPMSF